MMETSQYLTIEQVADMFQVSPITIYRWMNKRGLPRINTPALRFDLQAVRDWAAARNN